MKSKMCQVQNFVLLQVTVRRSERVRKHRYNIHPDDIGNNDDENYKMKKMKKK